MKIARYFVFALFLAVLPFSAAQSTTPHLNLSKPARHDPDWNTPVNANFDILDNLVPASSCLTDGTQAANWDGINKQFFCQTIAAGAGTSSAPKNTGQIAGASGAFASNNIRYVNATNYMWTQSPATDLSATGSKTITLTPCPLGVDGADTWNYVRIATTGTPEDVQITGGTCVSGAASGTITVTTTQTHSAGYTVASSTQGWQEASNDARLTPTNPTGSIQYGVVIGSPGEYTWTATMYVRAAFQSLDFSGTIIQCQMSAPCLFLGNTTNSNSYTNIRVKNFRGRPMIANGTFPMIEDNANASTIDGVLGRNGFSGGTFGYQIQVDNDQAADISHVDAASASPNLRCDATFCGSSIYAPGPFGTNAAVGYVHENNLSPGCAGNGIDWQSGNTLRVENTVIQGFAQFGIRAGGARGGNGNNIYHNVYMEVGSCSNPAGNIGLAGLINQGQLATITGGEGPVGQLAVFNTQGGTRRNYFIVVHDSVLGTSVPLFAGYGTPTSGTITVTWPQVTGTNTVTYDVLATSGAPSNAGPSIIPIGTANQAVHGAVGISGSCTNGICTATDTFATALDSYAVPVVPTYFPLLNFWPGNIILTTTGDTTNGDNVAAVVGAFSGGGPIITENWQKPTVFATDCIGTGTYSSTFSSCLAWSSSQNGAMPGATILQDGAEAGILTSLIGTKGRLIFNPGTVTEPTRHIITLVDTARQKTFSTPNQRAAYDAADSYIGIDQDSGNILSNVGIAFGAPISLSNYIGSNPDGSAYLERLTSASKTLKVPLLFSADNTLDIGAVGATRPRTGYFGTSVISPAYNLTNLAFSATAPTISSGFGTSPSVTANNGTAAFRINVGTGGSATSGVIGMPAATTGWNCSVNDLTAAAAHVAYNTRQTASSTTSVTVENQTTSTGAAVAWAASDILSLNCTAF